MIEFNLILAAVNPNISSGMFWRLMIGTVVMLTCGYLGENHLFFPGRPALIGFVLGLAGWGYILSEIFTGEAGSVAAGADMNKYVASSFKTVAKRGGLFVQERDMELARCCLRGASQRVS